MTSPVEGLTITPARYDHPHAVQLTERVQDFYLQQYGGTDDAPVTTKEFLPPSGAFLLGYLGDEPVAMGGWRFLPSGPAGAQRPVELKRMFVRPELRGRGFGLQILRALEHSAAEAGADWVLLQTGKPQTQALRLYRSAGYAEVEPFGFYACMPKALHLGRALDRGQG